MVVSRWTIAGTYYFIQYIFLLNFKMTKRTKTYSHFTNILKIYERLNRQNKNIYPVIN